MQLNINMQIDEAAEIKKLEAKFREQFASTANVHITRLFADGRNGYHPQGAAYALIAEFIEDKMLEVNSKKICEEYIAANWERILHEATDKALRHKANGIAFQRTKE